MDGIETLPIVVIGAGPVGLAAAARLVERGLRPFVLERGPEAGAAVAAWGHVRVFSPWSYNIDAAARDLLAAIGWRAPDPEALPTGRDLVREYLAPLAAHPAIAPTPDVRCPGRGDHAGIARQGRVRRALGRAVRGRLARQGGRPNGG